MKQLFGKLTSMSRGTFAIKAVSARAAGSELIVTHVRPTLQLNDAHIQTDAVVVWRIVRNRIAEIWDIPAVHTASVSRAAR